MTIEFPSQLPDNFPPSTFKTFTDLATFFTGCQSRVAMNSQQQQQQHKKCLKFIFAKIRKCKTKSY